MIIIPAKRPPYFQTNPCGIPTLNKQTRTSQRRQILPSPPHCCQTGKTGTPRARRHMATLWWPMECHLLLTIMSKTLKVLANSQLSILEKGWNNLKKMVEPFHVSWKSKRSNCIVASDFSANYSWHFLAAAMVAAAVARPGQAWVRSQVLLLRKEVTTGSFPRLRETATENGFFGNAASWQDVYFSYFRSFLEPMFFDWSYCSI